MTNKQSPGWFARMNNRDLDIEVATKVMGWEHSRDSELRHKCDGKFHTPNYSTDISEAWKVVEKLKGIGFEDFNLESDGFEWSCYITDFVEKTGKAEGEKSAPMAICKAALEAMK